MLHTPVRNSLSIAIAIALTATVTLPTRAFAQQAAATADAQTAPAKPDSSKDSTNKDSADLGTITVTGYRYSIEKSLDQKRDANDIVEVITAEDISKFPDKNVADALARVPGVIVSRDGGEGKNVSVRGLNSDLTLTELNGNYVATAESNGDPTRSFNYTLLPANMLGSAELFKTQEARLDEGGIGGTVILHTRRPLDLPSGSGFGSIEGTWANTTKQVDPQFSGMYSWHSDDDRFGVLAGLTFQKRETRSMQVSTESWQWFGSHGATDVNGHSLANSNTWWGEGATTVNGNAGYGYNDQSGHNYSNFMRPQSVDFGIKDETRERKGGQLTAQFKPTDNLTLTGNYFRFQLQDNYVLNMLKVPEWNFAQYPGDGNWPSGRHLTGLNFDPSGTIVTGAQFQMLPGKIYPCNESQAASLGYQHGGWGSDDCAMPTPAITGEYHVEKALSQTINLEAEWHSDFIDADFKGGRTWASGGPSQDFKIQFKPRLQNADGTYTNGNTYSAWSLTGTPSMTFSSNLMQNLLNGVGQFDSGSSSSSYTRNSNYQNFAQADFTKHVDNGWLDSLQFGAKYRDGGVHRNTGNYYWNCPHSDPTNYYNVCPNDITYSASFIESSPISNIPGGFTASSFPAINFPAVLNYLNKTFGGSHNHPEDNFVYNVDEKIWSTYFQANFKTDRFRGNVGVRVVRTEQHADSTDSVHEYLAYFQHDTNGNVVNCLPGDVVPPGYGTGYTCQGGYLELPASQQEKQTWVLSTVDRTYTDVLPSANFAYNLTDDLLLRGAASKAVSRPAYADIASPGSLNYVAQQYYQDHQLIGGGGTPGWTGSGSNKFLEPYKANQFDVALEWYFHPGSVLGADVFRKNVSNFAVPVALNQQMTIGGNSVTVQGFSTTAGGRNGTSTGLELYAQHTLDFGLGFQVNYTYNKTNEASIVLNGTEIAKSPLVGSAKNQANFTVFYETNQWLLRASFNHRGKVVEGIDGGGQTGLLIYDNPYNQLDLNAAYNYSDRLTLTGSVLNATKQEQKSHLGNDTDARFYSSNYSGRILYFGATYKF
ncbi:TonB-dependent receptor [Rudaea sp.]|uniref:TonB-dependent receptor n=1 Tax=Rudaea sp. TaxID=2136325 RepID=UPI002ED2A07C